jgi:hypothetical protein
MVQHAPFVSCWVVHLVLCDRSLVESQHRGTEKGNKHKYNKVMTASAYILRTQGTRVQQHFRLSIEEMANGRVDGFYVECRWAAAQ